jgi:hypothetical protein
MVSCVVPVIPFRLAETGTTLFEDFLVRTTPLPETIAYFALLVRHETPDSTRCEPSLKLPVAVIWIFECGGTIGFAGVTVMEMSVAVETLSVADPLSPP